MLSYSQNANLPEFLNQLSHKSQATSLDSTKAKDYKNIKPDTDVKDILHTIQGCETWTDYSHGGCFCIMDGEVAEMCCTPSELKNYHYNSETKYVDEHHGDMDWLDVQAVMLYQAEKVLLGRFVTKNMPDRRTSNYATRK